MKYLNSKYKLFEYKINDIIEKCKKYKIKKYKIDDDGLLTVFEDVDLNNKKLKVIPLKFKEVQGCFDISYNDIVSLYGSPFIVGENFDVSCTKIKNLKYAPNEICQEFYCDNNMHIVNIKYFPKHVGDDTFLRGCVNLKSLYGCLKFLNGGIDVGGCHSLNTLKYGPSEVQGFYICDNCKLKTLYGAPKYVEYSFNCSYNILSSLRYSPRYIGGNFIINNNNISSFYYFPDYVGGDMYCENNPVYNVWQLFGDEKHIEYFNQMKIISDDGKKINIKKMNMFLKFISKGYVDYVEGYKNI